MGFLHGRFASEKKGVSRINPQEAEHIALWLKKNYLYIINYSRQCNPLLEKESDEQVFIDSVAVVTPFSLQAKLILQAIDAIGLPKVVVGTVHSLQGAERLIILFSSVYGLEDKKISKFYDRSHHMLNVAVSRAKNIFILFGEKEVFGQQGSKEPSTLLRAYLSEIEF